VTAPDGSSSANDPIETRLALSFVIIMCGKA
jgi:hypothetical protein